MIRILQVVNAADREGAETMAMNLYRNIDRDKFSLISLTTTVAKLHMIMKSGHWEACTYLPYNYFQYVCAWKCLLREHPEYKIIHIHNYNIAGIVSKVTKEMGVRIIITH